MAYKFNPFTGNLDEVGAGATAFEVLGTVATVGDLPGGATQGDVYLVEADDNFYVWDGSAWTSIGTLAGPTGATGAPGSDGADGADGADGVGVITGGTTGQVLAKASNTDYDTEWVDQTGGGGGGTPGGSDTQVQFNDGGSFAGDSGLVYYDTTGSLTVGGKTVTTDAPILNLSQTWNSATTTFTGLKLNVTDTASANTSKLLDLQVNGVSKFYVSDDSLKTSSFSYGSTGAGTAVVISANGGATYSARLSTSTLFTIGTLGIAGSVFSGTPDVALNRDAANVLALRNGTNAQTYRLYNTYTDASNYERGFFQWDSNVLKIGTEKGGTGAARNLKLSGPSPASSLTFSTAGINTSDHVTLSSAFRAGGNAFVAVNGTFQLGFTSTSNILSTVDAGFARDSAGVVKITDGSTGTGYLKKIPTTVGALTAAATVGAGTEAFVTDSTSTLSAHHGQVVVGGGTNFVPVFSDGTNWIVG